MVYYPELIQTDAEGLVEKINSKLIRLYSALSKGVHHELLVPVESILDRDTVWTLLNNTFANFVLAWNPISMLRLNQHHYTVCSVQIIQIQIFFEFGEGIVKRCLFCDFYPWTDCFTSSSCLSQILIHGGKFHVLQKGKGTGGVLRYGR